MLFGLRQHYAAMASALSATTCTYTFLHAHNDEGMKTFPVFLWTAPYNLILIGRGE